jgi:glycerophosphoryl diester phosphodiesterase
LADRFQEILKGRPVILGHRGCPGKAQENSLESFRLALDAGADGIELDVHGTSDGELIVFHDDSLTDGPFIREHTYAAVKKAAQERNIVMHTLEEVFDDLKGKGIINIEMKQTGIAEQALTLARLLLPSETFLFSSFIPEAVAECRRLAVDVPAVWIQCGADDLQILLDTIRRINASGVAFEHTAIDEPVAGFFRDNKVPLFTWTVNDIEEAKRMETLGVAGIITDRPDELMKYFKGIK